MKKSALTILAVVVLAGSLCFAADALELKFKPTPGEKRTMKMNQKNNITQTMQGQQMTTSQDMEMVSSYDVLAVEPNGLATLKMKYESMKMKMTSPQMNITYDSTKPADTNNPGTQAMAAVFSSMVGSELTMKVKPTGVVSEVTGMAELMKKASADIAGPGGQMAKQMMENMFDEEKLKDSMGQMFVVFPDGPVETGDAWYDDLGMDIGFPVDITTTYMLKKRDKGLAYIDASAKMDMGESSQKIEMAPGMNMGFQFAGVISQSIVVDEPTGWALSGNGSMNLSGIIKMDANEQMPKGMKMPMQIEGTFTFETTDPK